MKRISQSDRASIENFVHSNNYPNEIEMILERIKGMDFDDVAIKNQFNSVATKLTESLKIIDTIAALL